MKMKLFNLRSFTYVLLLGLLLTSCSKDDSPTDIIVGTWTAGSSTLTTMVGNKTLLQYFTDVMGLTAIEAQAYAALVDAAITQGFTGTIQIKSDNTYISNLGGESDTGTWSLSADGKKLTIDSSTDDPVILDIAELTSSKLHILMMDSMSEDLDGDDIPETISITADITFNK
ncbi:MAG TPA: DUF4923 family protein [Anaerovoracaceae bacterium]|nr:DUF4923 family protein [Anaerovoracaceae bacterium]